MENENKHKSNKQFMILSAIGIFAVVIGHSGSAISMLNNFFPTTSYVLPLFIFISGYFYKEKSEEHVFQTIGKKAKKILLPFFIWNVFYGIIITIFKNLGIVKYGEEINFMTLFVYPWLKNGQFLLNFAAWFVPSLFLVNIAYIIIRKLKKHIKYFNDYILLILLLMLGMLSIKLSPMVKENIYWIILFRVLFFLPFFHIGYLYRNNWEKYDNKINSVIYLIGLLMINLIALLIYKNINYSSHHFTGFKTNAVFLPFIVSMVGILFWLRISKILVNSLGDSKIINYISENTYSIMTHHMLYIFFLNVGFYVLHTKFHMLEIFNVAKFQTNILYWYCPNKIPQFYILYTMVGMIGPLVMKYLYDHFFKLWTKYGIQKIQLVSKKKN